VLSTFDRYTDAAKRAIYFARLEANHQNADAITPEHILAGMTWEGDSTLGGIAPLKELAVTLRAQMEIPHLPSTSFPYLRDRDIPLTRDGKKVLAYAVVEADRRWDYWIDCDHLLRGLLRFPNVASHALEQTGINLNSVRSASKSRRREHPANPPPRFGYLKLGISRNRYILAWLAFLLAAFTVSWIWSFLH
jgi:ATP-dependent Clp protease ATP-binding subunit ClpA